MSNQTKTKLLSDEEKFKLDKQKLSRWVGYVALFLPIVLGIAGALPFFEFRDSISANYYSVFLGDGFVVSLAFIGTFLIAYRDKFKKWTYAATLAGFATFFVAVFPTDGPGIDEFPRDVSRSDTAPTIKNRVFVELRTFDQSQTTAELDVVTLTPDTAFAMFNKEIQIPFSSSKASISGLIHYGSAFVLFSFLTLYCFIRFRQFEANNPDHGDKAKLKPRDFLSYFCWKNRPNKFRRNRIYEICSGLMILSMIALGAGLVIGKDDSFWDNWNLTFVFEALALIAFGIAWLVHGRSTFLGRIDFYDKGEPTP